MNATNRTTRWLLFPLLAATPAFAQPQEANPGAPSETTVAPSTQPAPPPPEGRPFGDGFRRGMDGGGPGFRGDGERFRGRVPMEFEEEPTPEEWDEAARFTQQHSPKRWDEFMKLPEEKRGRVRQFMFWRFNQVDWLRQHDPEMFDLQVRRLKVEDEIFPLAWKIRRADGDETDEVRAAREALRTHVETLVDIGLKEREARIARMKQRVRAEEEQLSSDRARHAELVQIRLGDIQRTRGGPWMGADGMRRPFVSGPEGRAGEPVGSPRPPDGR